jgi:hypothetical protein
LPGCHNSWKIPAKPDIATADDFFDTIEYGVWHHDAKWVSEMELEPTVDPYAWTTTADGVIYNPHRVHEGNVGRELLELCRKYSRPLPVQMTENEGYSVSVFQNEKGTVVQLIALDYDTDIDHHLDEIRFHRSRVNFVNKAEPIGVTQVLRGLGDNVPVVYTPFCDTPVLAEQEGEGFVVRLHERTSYVILHFPN